MAPCVGSGQDEVQKKDLTLLVGPLREEFHVHGELLGTVSPFFKGKLEELQKAIRDNSVPATLVFENVNPKYMKIFLLYAYTGDLWTHLEGDGEEKKPLELHHDLISVFKTASYFSYGALVELCVKLIKSTLITENALIIYKSATTAGHEQLATHALTFICKNFHLLFEQEEFEYLPAKCVKDILKQDDLWVEKEVHVFNALLRWGETECLRQNGDLKNVLSDFLPLIRFTQMSAEEFRSLVVPRRLLCDEILTQLLLFFMTPEPQRPTLPEAKMISTNARIYKGFKNRSHVLVKTPGIAEPTPLFDIGMKDTIAFLKSRLNSQFGYPTCRQVLYHWNELRCSNSEMIYALEDYGIRNGDTIHLSGSATLSKYNKRFCVKCKNKGRSSRSQIVCDF